MKNIHELINELQSVGIQLSLENDALKYRAPKGMLTPTLRNQMIQHKVEIINFLRQLQSKDTTAIPIISREHPLVLSFAQQRLWLLHQLVDCKQVYNIPCVWRLQGLLDVAALEHSLNQLVARHETLRINIIDKQGELVQVIAPVRTFELPVIDLSTIVDQDALIQHHLGEITGYEFDLEKDALIQTRLLRINANEHLLTITLHHLIADGWALDILIRELIQGYTLYLQQEDLSSLPTLPIQYADFANWQRQAMQQGYYGRHLAYWQQQLAAAPALLNLPTDRPRPPQQSFHGTVYESVLPQSLLKQLKALTVQTETTLFMVLDAAFAVLLARYSGQEDILIGSPIANRNRLETENLIGCFVNTLVLRTRLDNNPSFLQLLEQVKTTTLEAYEYQDLPFDSLVEALSPERNASYSPLFQVMLVLNSQTPVLQFPNLTTEPILPHFNSSAFDLTLSMQETNQGIKAYWEYASALFDSTTIHRMAQHLQMLLEGMVANPSQPVLELPLLTKTEQQLLLLEWNHSQAGYPYRHSLSTLFEALVIQTPNNIAVVYQDACLTYAALNQRANRFAHHLLRVGVQPDTLVGICVERSLDTVAAMLGVLKAGAAYVPLDPNYPVERLSYMLEDSRISILVTQTQLIDRFAEQITKVIYLDERDTSQVLPTDDINPGVSIQPEQLAYVIYTSGSTGKPKGVMIPQRALINRALALAENYALKPNDRVLQFAAFSFDVAAEEIFPTLLRGGTIVGTSHECTQSVPLLMEWVAQQGISVLNLPAPYWHEWVVQLKTVGIPASVRLVIAGSDKVLKKHLATWKQHAVGKNIPVYCGYGPTETTITATLYKGQDTTQGLTDSVFIGQPLADTQTYVLDAHLQPVPIGVPGELHIAGMGLARGYLYQPELTEEKFIPNPFSALDAHTSARLYKTGDLVRYLPDGNIEFLGRVDEQVKIRGFRIELGEIEAVLHKHPSVHAAVVLAKEKQPGHNYLVAYVVPKAKATIIPHPGRNDLKLADSSDTSEQWHAEMRRDLRDFVQNHLPDYMMPAVFMLLDHLPLSPSGKLDLKALPKPEVQSENVYVAPRTSTEKLLAGIWQDVLQIDKIGTFDSFFNLGGHSLLVTRLLHSIKQVFGVDLLVSSLFDYPTLTAFAHHIDQTYQGLSGHSKTIDFYAEVRLDEDILPPTSDFNLALADLDAVFLTGATGFVGAYLLYELLKQTKAQIYCLVRANTLAEGEHRLHHSLSKYGLEPQKFTARVVPVLGDLAKLNFGLSHAQFDELATKIDVIYHNGAWVNHVYPYSVLKAANVGGTQEALRLACRTRTKPLHFISSLSVFGPEITDMYEDAELDRPELLENGYVETKWVADKLASLAGQRGLPVTIHRVSGVSGITENGFSYVNDNFFRMFLTTVQLGICPDTQLMDDNLVPVDFASRAIVHLASQPSSLGKVFHVGNPQNTPVALINKALRKLVPIHLLPPKQWQTEILRQAQDNPEIGLYPLLPLIANYNFDREPKRLMFDCKNMLRGLEGSGIDCPVIDQDKLAAYFSWLGEHGYLPLPKNKDAALPTKHVNRY